MSDCPVAPFLKLSRIPTVLVVFPFLVVFPLKYGSLGKQDSWKIQRNKPLQAAFQTRQANKREIFEVGDPPQAPWWLQGDSSNSGHFNTLVPSKYRAPIQDFSKIGYILIIFQFIKSRARKILRPLLWFRSMSKKIQIPDFVRIK